MTISGKQYDDVPMYGAFCTGSYSYVWNSGYFWADNADFDAKKNEKWAWVEFTDYANGGKTVKIGESEKFRLIRVGDTQRMVCAALDASEDGHINVSGLNYGIIKLDDTVKYSGSDVLSVQVKTIEMLSTDQGGNDLALYDLNVWEPAISTTEDNVFYAASLILGTVSNGVNIMANGSSCAAPEDYEDGNFDYCAINKFNFAMQVNGG